MADPLKNLFILTAVVIVLIALWAITIGFTYWDAVSRRKLPGIETAAWVALVVLLPGVGFAAYILGRLLGGTPSPGSPAELTRRWVTLLKRPQQPEQRTGTIAASDFLQSTPTEAFRSQTTRPTRAAMVGGVRRYKLTLLAGPHVGVDHLVERFPVKIGRGIEVAIPLDEDMGVSRLHAEIYEQAGGLRIRDLKSTHGTQVNDHRISDQALKPGDRIQVGVSILLVEVLEERP
jgi:hypothetical protein